MKKRKARILVEKIGQMTYYSPQVQRSFLGITYWSTFMASIYGGFIIYFNMDSHRFRDKSDAEREFTDYMKLKNEELYFNF